MASPLEALRLALAGRYSLERELGAGGMATVYLAHDVRHNRRVAIKVLRPDVAALIGAERFLKEIETTANLQHPNILPLFDSGRVDGTVFFVMPTWPVSRSGPGSRAKFSSLSTTRSGSRAKSPPPSTTPIATG
jgi:hypothetical protein